LAVTRHEHQGIAPDCRGLPSRTDYFPQQPPRKKVITRKTTTTIITHSIKVVLSPDGGSGALILKASWELP